MRGGGGGGFVGQYVQPMPASYITLSHQRECDQGVYYSLLWVAVDLLQVLWETWRRGRDGGRWQQVPLLQQVDHSQGLRGAGLEAHGSQGRAQLGRTRTNRWLGGEGGGWRVNLNILHRHGSQ